MECSLTVREDGSTGFLCAEGCIVGFDDTAGKALEWALLMIDRVASASVNRPIVYEKRLQIKYVFCGQEDAAHILQAAVSLAREEIDRCRERARGAAGTRREIRVRFEDHGLGVVNGIRRAALAQCESVRIERCQIFENTSAYADEVISTYLSNVLIDSSEIAAMLRCDECPCVPDPDPWCDRCAAVFHLDIACPPGEPVHIVCAGDLVPRSALFRPLYPKADVLRLSPGERIRCICVACRGSASGTHERFAPCTKAAIVPAMTVSGHPDVYDSLDMNGRAEMERLCIDMENTTVSLSLAENSDTLAVVPTAPSGNRSDVVLWLQGPGTRPAEEILFEAMDILERDLITIEDALSSAYLDALRAQRK